MQMSSRGDHCLSDFGVKAKRNIAFLSRVVVLHAALILRCTYVQTVRYLLVPTKLHTNLRYVAKYHAISSGKT